MTKDLKIKALKAKVATLSSQLRQSEAAVRALGQQCEELRRQARKYGNGKA